jgi:hypothetical protein
MDIKTTTKQMLKILYILSWIIFIGVCTEAGSFIFNGIFTVWINGKNASYFRLSGLYEYDSGYFLVELLFMTIVAMLRATIFYLIIRILRDNKLNLSQPFNHEVGRLIFKISYLSFGTGIFSSWGVKYTEWLVERGIKMPDIEYLRLGGADVWIFTGVILYVIGHIFKRGIEIQTENELTV